MTVWTNREVLSILYIPQQKCCFKRMHVREGQRVTEKLPGILSYFLFHFLKQLILWNFSNKWFLLFQTDRKNTVCSTFLTLRVFLQNCVTLVSSL